MTISWQRPGAARAVFTGVAMLVCLTLAGCAAQFRDYGYAPDDAELEELVVGIDDQARVEELYGRPAVDSLIRDTAWYYVASRQRTFLFTEPQVVDRQVVQITFDEEAVVQNIERFTLADGRVIALSRRVTDSNTQGVSFLRQLLGNVGRVSTETLTGN